MKGSHNSLTYAKPLRWWAWLILPVWRCQCGDIDRQIDAGAMAFDFRIVRTKNGGWLAAHGCVDLKANIFAALARINSRCPGAFVRIVLERGSASDCKEFAALCASLTYSYPAIHFFGANYKPNWKRLHTFDDPEAARAEAGLTQHVGSMSGSWYGKVWPWLWSKLNRSKVPAAVNDKAFPIVLTDFV